MISRFFSWSKSTGWWKWIPAGLWALTMIGLPLTSFPLLTRATGATVAPFSAIPLAVLALVWFIPYLVKGGKLPRENVPLIVFGLFVIGLAAFAFFQIDWSFRSKSLIGQTLRTFVPFGIGLAFLFITSAWQNNVRSLRRTLQFIYAGGGLLLVWSVAQAVVVFKYNWQYPAVMQAILNSLVTQSTLAGNPRLAGLTWEASWLAHQLNMLYLPLWLASTYQRTSVFPKLWKLSFENVCLVVGLGIFFLSSPRIGGVAFMLMLLFLFLKFNLAAYRWIIRRLFFAWASFRQFILLKIGIGALVVIGIVIVYIGSSYALFKIASERDWRVGLMVNSPLTLSDIQQHIYFDEETLYFLGLRFAFMERTVYWMTGLHIFYDNPFIGVGLGNAGYYFIPHLPAVGWSSYEIRAIIYQNDSLPNIKSIWYRLLAETGIVGFSIYVVWLLILWTTAAKTLRSKDPVLKTVALAGQLAILAYIFEGFSVDTFGLPYLFVITGLTASAGLLYRQELRKNAVP
jgi:hypothetical protein